MLERGDRRCASACYSRNAQLSRHEEGFQLQAAYGGPAISSFGWAGFMEPESDEHPRQRSVQSRFECPYRSNHERYSLEVLLRASQERRRRKRVTSSLF